MYRALSHKEAQSVRAARASGEQMPLLHWKLPSNISYTPVIHH